jgi:hypothetical protein
VDIKANIETAGLQTSSGSKESVLPAYLSGSKRAMAALSAFGSSVQTNRRGNLPPKSLGTKRFRQRCRNNREGQDAGGPNRDSASTGKPET